MTFAQTTWTPTSSGPVAHRPSRYTPVIGSVEQVARGAPSTLLAVSRAGFSARGGITQLAGVARRAADGALAGVLPVVGVGAGVHAETKPTNAPKARTDEANRVMVREELGACGLAV